MSVTIRDVARVAGVSVATVSRAFNGSGPVSADARRRIRNAARRLRYVPNGAARSLITRRTTCLGVLLPDLYGEFFSEVIRGIDQRAQRGGYHLLVSSSHDGRQDIAAALCAMRGRVDGLVIMSPDINARALAVNLPDTLPVVLLNCAVGGTRFDSVTVDNYGGAYAVVSHLAALGHRRIAIITGPARNLDAAERLRGYRAALQAAGLAGDRALEAIGDFTEASGYRATTALARVAQRPTAIFAANDSMAIGALGALRELGLRVPEEVAIAGFDDIQTARYLSPPLSSVHVPISELGTRATELLLNAIGSKNRHARRQEALATTLVVRESCGARQPSTDRARLAVRAP